MSSFVHLMQTMNVQKPGMKGPITSREHSTWKTRQLLAEKLCWNKSGETRGTNVVK